MKIFGVGKKSGGLLRIHCLIHVVHSIWRVNILLLAHGQISIVSLRILAKLLYQICSLHLNLLPSYHVLILHRHEALRMPSCLLLLHIHPIHLNIL
jgi:hypothetical protein